MSDSPGGSFAVSPADATVDVTQLGAAELTRRIADRAITAVEVCEAHIARIEAAQPRLNMVSRERFQLAREEAQAADQRRDSDEALPPLLGVPISVKECFDVAGMPTNLGTTTPETTAAQQDAPLVKRLRDAGGIVLAKTNVPQLMLFMETDNPRFGCTVNPWDESRTCSGSSGGEAVMSALGGSALGVGSDMGGSLRVPAHACGVHAFKPTSRLLSSRGILRALSGMAAVANVPGFFARQVEDLALALDVGRVDPTVSTERRYLPRVQPPFKGIRVAVWEDDGFFPVAPAIRRAVKEAADVLCDLGAVRISVQLPSLERVMALFFGALAADGGSGMRRLLAGSTVDHRLHSLLRVPLFPDVLRRAAATALRHQGKHHAALFWQSARKRSVDEYWRLCVAIEDFRHEVLDAWDGSEVNLALLPVHALPALPLGKANHLVTAGAYSILINLLDLPSGALSITTVGDAEQSERDPTTSPMMGLAARAELGSAGLPVAVQVVGMPYHDRLVLGVMSALEKHFCRRPDYPPSRHFERTERTRNR